MIFSPIFKETYLVNSNCNPKDVQIFDMWEKKLNTGMEVRCGGRESEWPISSLLINEYASVRRL